MSTRVVDVVDDWDEQSFTGGYRTLHELADEEFSGVCRAGGAELYLTSGTVVGVLRGVIEDFEGSEGTIYEAPSPALPLLAVMQERSDEVRAQYYTEDTPITEVDRTLSDGGFSGYLELSENVLSGDYFLVYYAGRSMSVAFVGASGRLIDGDEAFETADDEVGIYEVRPVDIDPIEIPEPKEPAPEPEESTGSGPQPAEATDDAADGTADDGTDRDDDVQAHAESPHSDPAADTDDESGAGATDEGTAGSSPGAADASGTTTAEATDAHPAAGKSAGTQRPAAGQSARETVERTGTGGASGQSAGVDSGSALERRAIPSLDPERTRTPDQPPGDRARSDAPSPDTEPGPAGRRSPQPPGDGAAVEDERADPREGRAQPAREAAAGRLEELEEELAERDEEVGRLEDELEAATEERDELAAELEEVRDERDELAAELEHLEGELERLETELGAAPDAEQRLTPAEALAGSDLFFRYRSKNDATLAKAHGSENVRREDVTDNLRLEKHTQFDAAAAAVGGQAYGEFVETTIAYRFVEWIARELLFEIRDTGHATGLEDLYETLPSIDRADFAGTVEVTYSENGQETRTEESFDVVLRDRMGNPLLVANINDSREAATQSMMENLVTAGERVGQSCEEFAGAFLVTRSFFEPGALECASEATQGGLLSRNKRESFVNLSRKRGFHLCLVEARNENFHLAVPEL